MEQAHGVLGFWGFGVWFDASRGEPMAKEVGFLDSPFAFAGIDDRTFGLKARKDCVEKLKMGIPRVAEAGNVVDVDFDVGDVFENFFHDFLSDVGGLTNAHGKAIVSVETKWGRYRAESFAVVVHHERVVLH